MQCMLSFESIMTQAIWWLTILADSYLLLERFINEFYYRFANFDRLEEKQLWLNLCYRQPAHKDSLLQASQDYH